MSHVQLRPPRTHSTWWPQLDVRRSIVLSLAGQRTIASKDTVLLEPDMTTMIRPLSLRLALRHPYVQRGRRCSIWMPAYLCGRIALHQRPDSVAGHWCISAIMTGEEVARWPTFCSAWRALASLSDIMPPDRRTLRAEDYRNAVQPLRHRVEAAGGSIVKPVEPRPKSVSQRKKAPGR